MQQSPKAYRDKLRLRHHSCCTSYFLDVEVF